MLDETTPSDASNSAAADSPEATPPAKKAAARKSAAAKAPAKKAAAKKAPAKRAAKKTAAPEVPDAAVEALAVATDAPAASDEAAGNADSIPAKKAPARRTRKTAAKQVAPADAVVEAPAADVAPADEAAPAAEDDAASAPAKKTAKRAPAKKAAAKKTTAKAPAKKTAAKKAPAADSIEAAVAADSGTSVVEADATSDTLPLFQAPVAEKKAPTRRTRKRTAAAPVVEVEVEKTEEELAAEAAAALETVDPEAAVDADAVDPEAAVGAEPETDAATDEGSDSKDDDSEDSDSDDGTPTRRRRRRGGRRRRRSSDSNDSNDSESDDNESGDAAQAEQDKQDKGEDSEDSSDNADSDSGSTSSRRRRRRRRSGDNDSDGGDDPENTVVRVRKTRTGDDQITAVAGSTRLEAKKQRRREGREAGRRRAPIVSEAEFLARREAVERVMVVRQRKDLTQIAVLEDKVLVEHYVARESQTSLIGNVYLGRVQNVLPSMEAAFVDIGKGRNAVLYAGEVNWSALGHKDGQQRKIESVLSPGQPVLVQVTKDPIGHKGARLTSQVSLAGRFLVYVPDGTTSGISRKLPDTERSRLKSLLKEIVPDSAGVIVRTAAEGASEEELTHDVERLKARWEAIEAKSRGNAPQLLHGEPDLTLKVVRDLFTEDFTKLVIEGDEAWQTVSDYVQNVAPDLADRLERYAPADNASAHQGDIFSVYRIDEQIAKGLDRKVWLPSGGSLVIDRTEAMTVVDVNTGKFTGSGGNLEETVTKNNLEAAEEIVRQLRLRDIGGIIVVDFIDMVLEANRDLVVRRLVECLGRDRTRHQVAEVTSLGLVQMTRKRIGTGLLESFSHDCENCQGRGVVTQSQPVEPRSGGDDDGRRSGGRRGRGRDNSSGNQGGRGGDKSSDDQSSQSRSGQRSNAPIAAPSPKDIAAMARHEAAEAASAQSAGGSGETAPAAAEATPAAQRDGFPAAETQTAETQTAEVQTEAQAPVVQVTTSRRSSRSRSRRGGQEQTPAPEAQRDETPAVETPAVETPAVETPAPEAPSDGAPRVITRTRRGASRSTTTSGTAVAVTVAPVVEEASVVKDTLELPPESKPRVVTRTRGRAAPQTSATPAVDAESSDAQDSDDGASETSVEHVPVKKKGARKR